MPRRPLTRRRRVGPYRKDGSKVTKPSYKTRRQRGRRRRTGGRSTKGLRGSEGRRRRRELRHG